MKQTRCRPIYRARLRAKLFISTSVYAYDLKFLYLHLKKRLILLLVKSVGYVKTHRDFRP